MKKSIVKWCKEQHEAGKPLSIKWEGGGDSGWAFIELDGEQLDNEYSRALEDHIYSVLDYGSFAGEFNTSGEAVYDVKSNSFEGTDHYSEDSNETLYLDLPINITVPKDLWFEQLVIECEANYDEIPKMDVRFIIKNGFLTKEHTDFCSNLEEVLVKQLEDVITTWENRDSTEELRGCNDSWTIERNEFKEVDGLLSYNIETIEIETWNTEDKEIMLELDKETAEAIDNQLNKLENAN